MFVDVVSLHENRVFRSVCKSAASKFLSSSLIELLIILLTIVMMKDIEFVRFVGDAIKLSFKDRNEWIDRFDRY